MLHIDPIKEIAHQFITSAIPNVPFEKYYTFKSAEPLGYGSTATVMHGVQVKTGKEVAIKVIFKNLVVPEMEETEINILRNLNHPNIIKLYDVFDTESEILLVMPLCRGDSLVPRLLKSHHFCEKDSIKIVKHLLSAVSYLHQRGIVHRDIKPENILFEDDSPDSKMFLADFGFSKKRDKKGALMSTMVGTWAFVAPDVICTLDGKSRYTSKCDIWSIGVVTFLMLFGEVPFKHALSNEQMTEELVNSLYNDQMSKNVQPMSGQVSEGAKDFVKKCLEPNPALRLSAEQALEHKWLKVGSLTSPLARSIAKLENFCKETQLRPSEKAKNVSLFNENSRNSCTLYQFNV